MKVHGRNTNDRLRAATGALAPSTLLLAAAVLGLLFDTYWQYVFAVSLSAAVVGGALAMLVGYARCITIATGSMLAVGAYGAAIPVVHGNAPFLGGAGPCHFSGRIGGPGPGHSRGSVSQPQSRDGHARLSGCRDHRVCAKARR